MQHLSPERIAALVDEPATHDEHTHFELCGLCRADFIAIRRIVAAAGAERDRPVTPLVPWQQLAGALRNEGLLPAARSDVASYADVASHQGNGDIRPIASAASFRAPLAVTHTRGVRRPWLRVAGMAAAATVLVTAGAVGGRLSAATRLAGFAPESAAVQPAAPSIPMTNVAQFRSPDDARATLHSAEEVYSGALLWLAAHDSALSPRQATGSEAAAMNYRQRLEVLDAAMATARRALYEAPDDPVMNRYYLATLGAREVTLRRLTTVLPASQQVLEY